MNADSLDDAGGVFQRIGADGQDFHAARLELLVVVLQLHELRTARRSPEGAIEHHHHRLLALKCAQGVLRTLGAWQREVDGGSPGRRWGWCRRGGRLGRRRRSRLRRWRGFGCGSRCRRGCRRGCGLRRRSWDRCRRRSRRRRRRRRWGRRGCGRRCRRWHGDWRRGRCGFGGWRWRGGDDDHRGRRGRRRGRRWVGGRWRGSVRWGRRRSCGRRCCHLGGGFRRRGRVAAGRQDNRQADDRDDADSHHGPPGRSTLESYAEFPVVDCRGGQCRHCAGGPAALQRVDGRQDVAGPDQVVNAAVDRTSRPGSRQDRPGTPTLWRARRRRD